MAGVGDQRVWGLYRGVCVGRALKGTLTTGVCIEAPLKLRLGLWTGIKSSNRLRGGSIHCNA